MSVIRNREAAMRKAAEGKLARELHSASQINDPWSRAVALAKVLEQTPDTEVQRVAEMALKAAQENKDAYKRVVVTAWVFYALIQCHKEAMASMHLPGVLADAPLRQARLRRCTLFGALSVRLSVRYRSCPNWFYLF